MKDTPYTAASRLADALNAKDRWRKQEINYNRAIQDAQEELASALIAESLHGIDVPGYNFVLCHDNRINITGLPR